MARYFVQYWKPRTAKAEAGSPFDSTYSGSELLGKVSLGDTVWIFTCRGSGLFAMGRVKVGRITKSWRVAENVLDHPVDRSAKFFLIARPSTIQETEAREITRLAPKLRFVGGVDRLPPRFSGSNLQTLRELSPESAVLLSRAWGDKVTTPVEAPTPPVDTDEQLSAEGQRKLSAHVSVERSRRNRNLVLASRDKPYSCDVCGFDFGKTYGRPLRDYIQVHHKVAVAAKARKPKIGDFALLCANCHAAVHWRRGTTPLSLPALGRLWKIAAG